MALEPERSKKRGLDRREALKVLLGGAAALAAGALPREASAALHPIDPEQEAVMAEEADIESRMQGYEKFMQERSLLIKTTLIMHGVFEPEFVEKTFANTFKMLMKAYVRERLKHESTADGMRLLADEGKFLSAWMIEEIEGRWKVSVDPIKEERIRSLIDMLSKLARESLAKENSGEQ